MVRMNLIQQNKLSLKRLNERDRSSMGDVRVLTRRCTTSGTWTGGEPTCKFVDCGMPELIENGDFVLGNNGTYFGSLVTHVCKEHFKLDGKKLFGFHFIYLLPFSLMT